MLEKLFETLDEKVFTSEVKEDLQSQFNEAVEVKALEVAAEKMEEKISDLEEKSEEYKAILEQEYDEKSKTLFEQVDAYLEKVVDDFIEDSKGALDESIKSEKADMIIEAMQSMLISTGVEIAKIEEAKNSSEPEFQLQEMTAKYDAIIEENIKLEKANEKLLKMGIISELKEGMNVVEGEKFEKLADLVDFENSESYLNKLITIKENIKVPAKIEEKQEEKQEENLDEKTEPKDISFGHLI